MNVCSLKHFKASNWTYKTIFLAFSRPRLQHLGADLVCRPCCLVLRLGGQGLPTQAPSGAPGGLPASGAPLRHSEHHFLGPFSLKGSFKGFLKAYNCHSGYSNWYFGWSVHKKDWCCNHAGLGCPGTWRGSYHFNAHMVHGVGHAHGRIYDCGAGFSNWMQGWSDSKKAGNRPIGYINI